MKPPKLLPCTWEDLTGLEELDSEKMEDLRLMFRTMLADGPSSHLGYLQRLFETNAEYILNHPTSDLSVVLYRLLEGASLATLNESVAISWASMHSSYGLDMTFAQFFFMVEGFFSSRKTPIPVVAGFRPGVYL
jgi:hypothetical protein